MDKILLHSCCAPCSVAIVEYFLKNNTNFAIFYSNSNIFPKEEYEIRKNELKKLTEYYKIEFFEDNYNHQEWLDFVKNFECEPERGQRCLKCFQFRLSKTAKKCKELNINQLTTTLSSSRWKNFNQIVTAGKIVESEENIIFIDKNWKKNGLQERRNQLIKQFGFYNQLYCGCEFSAKKL